MGLRAPTHLHTVVKGSQSLGLVILREGSAQTAVPLVPLRTGAVGTKWREQGMQHALQLGLCFSV